MPLIIIPGFIKSRHPPKFRRKEEKKKTKLVSLFSPIKTQQSKLFSSFSRVFSEMEILNKLKNLDAYPKIKEDFYSRTLSGGIITLVSFALILFLFLSEASEFSFLMVCCLKIWFWEDCVHFSVWSIIVLLEIGNF